jgi:putative tryptophan/tyrosine transport system substrate-binding protein
MKRLARLAFLYLGCVGLATSANAQPQAGAPPLHIAIVAIVDHPMIDALRGGIADSLRSAGLAPGERVRISFESARADPRRAQSIARSLRDGDADLVIALSEPMARLVADMPLAIPVLAAGIPLALADKLSAERRDNILTGVATDDNPDVQLALIAALRPDVRTVLLPYAAQNAPPGALLDSVTAAARNYAFVVFPWPIAGDNATIPRLAPPARTAIFLAADAIDSQAGAVLREADRVGIPVIADRRELVVDGATAATIHDFHDIGRQTGRIAATILRNPAPAQLPFRHAEARFLVVNNDALTDRRLNLALDLAGIADETIDWAHPNGPAPVSKPTPPRLPR